MNKKLIVSGVLAGLMMGGLSGVQAAPSLDDHETRIANLESLTDQIETDHEAIKNLKKNKADGVDTENALTENKNSINTEIKNRKSANRKLNKLINKNAEGVAENKKGIEANNIAINNQISNIKGAYESIKDINKTLEDSGARATAEATQQAREAAAAAQKVADGMTASQAAQDKNIEKNTKDIAEGKIALQNQISNIKGAYALIKEHDVAINNQVANIRQSFELIKENKTGIEANKTAIAALDKKLTGADLALGGRIDQLATDTDKGLAKAYALAALHPLDFDPSSKLNFAVAGGFYNGENAVAFGAFYRPNRNVMLSFGSSIAGGENAYNVGLSVKVGKGGDRINQSNTTISELYDLVGRLQDQVAEQQKKIEELQAK